MREILFRVCDVQKKVLANATSIMWLSEDEVEIDHDKNGVREPFQIHPDTAVLEQFTGLHDATKWEDLTDAERDEWIKSGHTKEDWNGKRIFEGDIVKHNNTHFVVEFSANHLGFICIDKKHKTRGGFANWRDGNWMKNVSSYLQIIGNIHDNPELLEAK